MRAHEFIFEEQIDEGLGKFLASIGLVGLLGTGAGLTIDKLMKSPEVTSTQKAAIAINQNIPNDRLSPEIVAKIPDAKTLIQKTQPSGQAKQDLDAITKPPSVQKFQVKPIFNNPYESKLKKFAEARGITGVELIAFMSQCAHETANFTKMTEMAGGSKYEPKFAKDKKGNIMLDPKTNKPVVINRDAAKLGNNQPGDGERFKGRGFIQLTGRDNYKAASLFVFGNLKLLEKGNEDLAADPEIAARIAVWYWKERVRPKVDNFQDVRDVTSPINPGLAGLPQRQKLFVDYMQAAKSNKT